MHYSLKSGTSLLLSSLKVNKDEFDATAILSVEAKQELNCCLKMLKN